MEMRKFLSSVRFAYQGIRYVLCTESNFRIQLFIFTLVMISAYSFKIPRLEFLLILITSALIFSLELINTAVERLADKVSPEYNEQIGVVKDMMAGAVLVSSIVAIIVGLVIFSEPLLNLFQR